MSGFIASYDESGEAQWCERIGEVPTEELYSQSWINTICFTANNTIFVGGYCLGQIKLDDTVIGNPIDGSISNYTGIIIEYDLNRNAKWSTSLKGTGNVIPKEITEMDDKSIIVAGEFTGNIELEELTYGEDDDKIKKILILFNIITMNKISQRFPFEKCGRKKHLHSSGRIYF